MDKVLNEYDIQRVAEGILSEIDILYSICREEIVITPLISADQLGPTIDLRLGTEFIVKRMDALTHYDPIHFSKDFKEDPEQIMRYYDEVRRINPTQYFVLHPSQFAIGCTLEYVKLPPSIGGQLEGKSSWAREGLNVHSTAGLIHPGHEGIIVFELHNAGFHPITLYPGARIAQLLFYRMTKDSPSPYGKQETAKYSKSVSTSIGRPWVDWEFSALSEKVNSGQSQATHK